MLRLFILSACFAKAPVFQPLFDEGAGGESPQAVSGVTTEEPRTGPQEMVSGVVRVIRAGANTEVFIIDRKDSLIIPAGSRHNEIFEACLQSSRARSPVSLVVNPLTRTVLSISKTNKESSGQSTTKGSSSFGSDSQKESGSGSK